MLDRVKFMETLQSVAEIMKTSREPMSQEEILGYFKDMELTKEQEDMIYEYYLTPQEDLGSQTDTSEEIDEEEAGKEEIQSADFSISEDWMEEDEPESHQNPAESQDKAKELDESEAFQESPILQMYLEEIKMLPKYTEQEEAELYQRLVGGEEAALKLLSDCWLERVLSLAKKHISAKAKLEDVIQEGNIGLFLKLGEWLGSGVKADFEQDLSEAVEDAMLDYIGEADRAEDGDHTVLGKVTLVLEAKKVLEGTIEREATLQELSEYTKMDAEELQGVLDLAKKAQRP